MSYSLFRAQINALTGMQHVSRTQFAQVIGNAYHGLVTRHVESLTAAGTVQNNAPKVSPLISGIHSITEGNLNHHRMVNFFTQISPYIYSYWDSLIWLGPTGIVNVKNTGSFMGPIIKQNFNIQIWISIFCAVCAVHILSVSGTYTNNITGITTPWSGGLLQAIPS